MPINKAHSGEKQVPTEQDFLKADIEEDLQKPSWLIQEQLYLKMGKGRTNYITEDK